jgi:hypothetical protein
VKPATPEETAAVAAVLLAIEADRAVVVEAAVPPAEHLRMWVEASRRSAQRAGLQRGPWRLSGRIARRSRI